MSGRPTIIVCADDFGISEAVSSTIVDLLGRGVINATSCLVEAPGWPSAVDRLRGLAEANPAVAVGLHLDLPSPWIEVRGARAAFEAQWAKFGQDLGRTPDFVDGHRHVHLFPAPKRALFDLMAGTGASSWLRQCRTSSSRFNAKRLVLDPLSLVFEWQARLRGHAVNAGFGGLRRFDPAEDMARLWRRDVAAMSSGGVLMVHPGGADPADPLSACRTQEAALLADGALAAEILACGFTMQLRPA